MGIIIQIVVICDCNSMKDSNLLLYVLLTQTSTTKPQSFTSFTSFKAIDGKSISVIIDFFLLFPNSSKTAKHIELKVPLPWYADRSG